MLNPSERFFFHVFGWMFLGSLFLYSGVFTKGLFDGFREGLGTATNVSDEL